MEVKNGEVYTDIEFKDLDLSNQELKDVDFTGCFFTNCKFFGSQLINSSLDSTKFNVCDLSLLKIKRSTFSDVIFSESKLTGINWTELGGLTFGVKFNDCIMKDNIFVEMNLRDAKFLKCDLSDADFSDMSLVNANFDICDLKGARFNNTDLRGADLSKAVNYSINPETNKIKGAKFSFQGALTLLEYLDIEVEQ